MRNDWKIGALRNRLLDIGYLHQSNGRDEPFSRSWNRLFAAFILEKGNFGMSIKPWLIVGDIEDNPDIEDYLGHGEVRAVYRWNKHVFSTLLRNSLKTGDNRGAIEMSWSFPLYENLRWYAQYYYGHGESLLDYNVKTNRFGLGVALNDYLR